MSKINVLILYGLPCCGKSSVLKAMSDYHAIAVDTIIKRLVADPSVEDFSVLSIEIIENIVSEIKNGDFDKYIIEMGCLIPKKAIYLLERFLDDLDVSYNNIKLSTAEDELVKRIINRNNNIDFGKSTGIKVDGPDYLTRFKLFFDKNQADNQVEIDTTGNTIENITLKILKHIE